MKKILLSSLIVVSMLLASCKPWDPLDIDIGYPPRHGDGIEAKCRHTAILQYLVFSEAYDEVEMVLGFSPPGAAHPYHLQTRVKIGDQWYWINTEPIWVFISEKDDFEPFLYDAPLKMVLQLGGITGLCDQDKEP